MSESKDNAMPEGWRRETWYAGTKVAWYVQSADGKGSACGASDTHAEALCDAAEAARYVRDTQEGRNQPPAPPAWMVEVAREGVAQANSTIEGHRVTLFCQEVREGHRDDHIEVAAALSALQIAISLGHVVVPRPMPSEEEMLKAAREDAAQCNDRLFPDIARMQRSGERNDDEIKAALQARRNMLREGAVAVQAAPAVDLKAALKKAWADGFDTAGIALEKLSSGEGDGKTLYDNEREMDVSAILEDLPTREA